MQDQLSTLLEDTSITDLVLTALFSIISLLLAFEEDVKEKQYQKKYILVLYFILFFGVIILNINNVLLTLSILLISLLSGVNLAYSADRIEKEQGRFFLIMYKIFEWLFTIKLYLIFLCYFAVFIFGETFNLNNEALLQSAIIITMLIYHLSSNIIDKFLVFPYDEAYRNLMEATESFDDKFKNLDPEDKENIISYIAFMVYMEDKDYFSRKSLTYNPFSVIRRKSQSLNNKRRSVKIFSRKNFRRLIKSPIQDSKRVYKKLKKVILKKIRGYSTMGQQFIRKNAMQEDSYYYWFRRKIFVEYIYTICFSKSTISYVNRVKYIKDKRKSRDYLKVAILKWYYFELSGFPKNLKALFVRLAKESSLSKEDYEVSWLLFMDDGHEYIELVNNIFVSEN